MAKNADATSMIESLQGEIGRHCFEQTPSKIGIVLESAHVVGKGVEYEMPLARPNKAQIGKARRREPFADIILN